MVESRPRPAEFVTRHVGPSAGELARMFATIGVRDLDELVDRVIPASIRDDDLDLPAALTEAEAISALRRFADDNTVATSLIGLGYHDTITPPVIVRNVVENPAWYTAYTPYQPEISQGRLEVLLNFQTLVCDLTGFDIANASMLDEGTAAAEAMTLLHRVGNGGSVFVVDPDCHPQTIAVVATRAEPIGIEVVVADAAAPLPEGTFGVLVQNPGSSGPVRDLTPVVDSAHASGALVAVATDLLACTLMREPGACGADAAVGSAQRFGVPLGFGGPSAGFLATRDAYRRSLPGRLVGQSVDTEGRPAHRLALQTREQHIRRERATSNICTAQVLLAVISALYAQYHGPDGLRRIARRVHDHTRTLAGRLAAGGVGIEHQTFFDTITARVPGRADEIVAAALGDGINLRGVDRDRVTIALDECTTGEIVERVLHAFGIDTAPIEPGDSPLAGPLARDTPFCEAETFNLYLNETSMLRYLRRLADKDLALDRSMIPLGSCTMKLNATTSMEPVTWPEFARIHPFAPAEQRRGYLRLIRELEAALVEITGYAAISLQPNAGSQGELAGLLAIRAFHRARGDHDRTICLIPSSAHGTNAASAVMAGMEVVVVACDDGGNVAVDDLERLATHHADRLAAIMVTYPSTHGVFEDAIVRICEIVHAHGGQVYLDGANLNAMVGLARPGRFGADVSHLNLHKTFTIPHGGGGPGVGPVAVRAHLAPYLPNHPLVADAGPETGVGPISAAPWGSAGILMIPWTYIAMMGADGLRHASAVAIATANYVAARLEPYFPVLYRGHHGYVAHECIVDPRPLKTSAGIGVDDIAKRLIDYGFHAPTVSFPVSGTLMIEPTESEDLTELDRFCDAMIAIRAEIGRIEAGEWTTADNPLVFSPHTADDLLVDGWNRAYPRAVGSAGPDRSGKYWPPVSRIDAAYGDKHLVCSCPPVSDYT